MSLRTVLVVDDEPHIRTLITCVLRRESYRVLEASDGEQALGVYEHEGPSIDLVMTDIVMPRMDGLELAERLYVLDPMVRVLYMSGKCDVAILQQRMTERGFGFIRKPFAIDGLVRKVQEVLLAKAEKKAAGSEDPPAPASAGCACA